VKIKGLLILLLVLALLLPLSSLFHTASVPSAESIGIGQNVIVVAKEDNVFARVSITVQPLVNGSGVIEYGGPFHPGVITFQNGTSITVTTPRTFLITLPNTGLVVLGGTYASGLGYDVSPSNPLSLQVLSDQNATLLLGGPIPGIQVYEFTLTGDIQFSAQALGVVL